MGTVYAPTTRCSISTLRSRCPTRPSWRSRSTATASCRKHGRRCGWSIPISVAFSDVGVVGGTHYWRWTSSRTRCRSAPGFCEEAAELVHTLATAPPWPRRIGTNRPRDLKPANVLITPDRRPVITDFGLALRLHSQDKRLTDPAPRPHALLLAPNSSSKSSLAWPTHRLWALASSSTKLSPARCPPRRPTPGRSPTTS